MTAFRPYLPPMHEIRARLSLVGQTQERDAEPDTGVESPASGPTPPE